MFVTVNGKSEEIKNESNLAQLVSNKGLCVNNLVVEHNRMIVPKNKLEEVSLNENDIIEIVSFVGGG